MRITYYREANGDFLCVGTERCARPDVREGRAAAIPGLPSSVSTTGISEEYLKRTCVRVPKSKVPPEWQEKL